MSDLMIVADRLRTAIRRAGSVCLLCDFDGTLAPLVETPAAATLDDATLAWLGRLNTHEHSAVGIISGRALVDVMRRTPVDDLAYCGNHGLELHWRDESWVCPIAQQRRGALAELCGRLREACLSFANAWVEDKSLTLTVHARHVRPEELCDLRDTVAELAEDAEFDLRFGHGSLEVRPISAQDKGFAASWIRARISPNQSSLPIYLGDDTTDEDAFRVLVDGFTVRVGKSKSTLAKYQIPNQAAVVSLLQVIGEELKV